MNLETERGSVEMNGGTTGSSRRADSRCSLRDIALFPEWRNRSRSTTIDGVTYKVASSCGEREAAFRLVHHAYTRVGLMQPNEFGMRVTPYHLLPTAAVFIATVDVDVVCTLTLVADGELGIPMEAIYADEVSELRKRGGDFAEVSCLADRRIHHLRQLPVLTRLIALMLQY